MVKKKQKKHQFHVETDKYVCVQHNAASLVIIVSFEHYFLKDIDSLYM